MKLPFLGSKKQKKPEMTDELMLAIDIGTEVLKTLLFRCSDHGVHVLRSSKIFQQQHAMRSGVIQSLDTVIENCRLGFNEVTKGLEEEHYPTKVVMGIAGELIHGVSIVVNYDREDKAAEEIDLKEQSDIFDQVKERVFESGKHELALKYGLSMEDIEVLHITITGAEVGGMPVDSLTGFTGKQVGLHFYASFGPKTYLEALRKVADALGLEVMGIVSQPFAVSRVFMGSSDKSFDGIFVDIGGGTTDIAIVKKGNVVDTQIFAFGGRVLTKTIAKEMNLDYRHAEARKLKYSNGELDNDLSKKVKKILGDDLDLWVEGLEVAFEGMEDIEQFPPYMYLCGGGAMLPDLRSTILENPWTQKLDFMRFPKVSVITPDKLDKIFDKKSQLENSMDVTVAGLARFAWDRLKYPDKHLVV
jgi:cell division protein FtsA